MYILKEHKVLIIRYEIFCNLQVKNFNNCIGYSNSCFSSNTIYFITYLLVYSYNRLYKYE